MRFTLVTSRENISKTYWISNGEIKKEQGGVLYEGEVQAFQIKYLSELKELIEKCNQNNALMFGVSKTKPEKAIIVASSREMEGAIHRNKEEFEYPIGSGLLLLDYDPLPGTTPLSKDQFITLMQTAIGESMGEYPFLWKASSSSNIYNDGQEHRGLHGQHMMVLVDDAREVPRVANLIFGRLWLMGYGTVFIDRAGGMHTRSVIDGAVNSPERLCFIKAAAVPPMTQRMEVEVFNDNALPLESGKMVELSNEQRDDILHRISVMRDQNKGLQAKTKQAWIEDRVRNNGLTVKQATQLLESQALPEHFTIITHNHGPVTVKQLVDDPDKYHGERCHDPIEPEVYDFFSQVAWIDLKHGTPRIWSHAHGGRNFPLVETNTLIPCEILKQLADEIFARQRKQNYFIAVIFALFIAERATSRRYFDDWHGAPASLFGIITGGTGMGKEALNTAANQLYSAFPEIKLHQIPQSSSALVNVMQGDAAATFISDEFGLKMEAKDQRFLGVMQELMQIYGRSSSFHALGGYSQRSLDEKQAEMLSRRIFRPCAGFLAMSTFESLKGAMSDAEIVNGFINRFIPFDVSGQRIVRNRNPVLTPFSQNIVEHTRAIIENVELVESQLDPEPHLIKILPVAQDMLWEFGEKMDEINGLLGMLCERRFENALRLCNVIAVWVNYKQPEVTKEIAGFVITLIHQNTQRFDQLIIEQKSKDGFPEAVKSVIEFLRKQKKVDGYFQCSLSVLTQKCRRYQTFRFNGSSPKESKELLLAELIDPDAGVAEIIEVADPRGGNRKPVRNIRLL